MGNVCIEARLKNRYQGPSLAFLCLISWTYRNRQFFKRHSRMNTFQTDKVLSKHVKYFQGIYPIDL